MAKKKKSRIPIKTSDDIREMRKACQTASEILQLLAKEVGPGKTTKDIDDYAEELIKERGCVSAFLGYRGFPGQTCLSLNEEVVHGIGNEKTVLKEGDVLKIDVGVVKGGWIGDNATTVPVGKINDETKRLLMATEQSLYEAMSYAKDGERLGDLCAAVDDFVRQHGFSVVRDFVGHGVGKQLHEEPQIPNYRPLGRTPRLRSGMVLAIEPMINAGTKSVRILEDGWTVVTKDNKYSSHFEHTVLVTDDGPDILTERPREATEEIFGIRL